MRGNGSVRDPSFVGRTRGEEQRKKSKGKREKWEGGSRRGNPNIDSLREKHFNAGNTVKTVLIEHAELSELTPATKTYLNVFKAAGTALGIVSALDAVSQLSENKTPGNYLRVGVSVATVLFKVNPAAAVVLGILDATGATDHAYQWIDHQFGY